MISLLQLARALGGDVYGSEVRCPGPTNSRRSRSLSVRPHPRAPDGFVVHSFSGEDPLLCRDYVKDRLGLKDTRVTPTHFVHIPEPSAQDDAKRTARALALWDEGRDPRGTPVEAYLLRRGLDLPQEAAGAALRFHPSCPFAGKRVAVMLALVRNIRTNEPQAIHRTALNLEGRKVEVDGKDRLALGPVGGGAVKITPDEDVTSCLGIGEGIETTLSLRHLPDFGSSPVWSLLNAGGIESLPPLPGIESLWIAADHDDAGLRASRACAARWRDAGAETFLIAPSAPRADLNDLLKREARHAY